MAYQGKLALKVGGLYYFFLGVAGESENTIWIL